MRPVPPQPGTRACTTASARHLHQAAQQAAQATRSTPTGAALACAATTQPGQQPAEPPQTSTGLSACRLTALHQHAQHGLQQRGFRMAAYAPATL